jgi:hypothetical protein
MIRGDRHFYGNGPGSRGVRVNSVALKTFQFFIRAFIDDKGSPELSKGLLEPN